MNPPVLIVLTGKHKGKRVRLTEPETLVGRDEGAKLRIATSEVSRQHCLLIIAPDGVIVRDLGSRNSTFINGSPLADETLLKPGDTLTIGPMAFELEGATPAEKQAKAVSTSARPKADPKASDDDIASWLVDDSSAGLSASDTTIVQNGPKSTESRPISKAPPKTPKKEFASVAEEAADIIRRHQAGLVDGNP